MIFKHIFFDLDHTLWDFDKNSALAMAQTLSAFDVNCDFDQFHDVYNPINEAYWSMYTKGEITKEALKIKRFQDAFHELNYDLPTEKIEGISVHYMEILPHFSNLIEGAKELLDELKLSHTLHVITNGFNEVSYKKLTYSGIIDYFDQIITPESTGLKKPNPVVFHHALEQANASPEESLMVGDNYEVDVLGAEAVGIKAVWFDHKKTGQRLHDRSITTLSDVYAVIA